MGKKSKISKTEIFDDNCVDPIEGPQRMGAHVERMVQLILSASKQAKPLSKKQRKLFDEIFEDAMSEHSHGATFGRGIEKALAKLSPGKRKGSGGRRATV